MTNSLKQWLRMALCCLPAVALVAIVGISGAVFGAALNGPLGLGLLTLAALACPLSMGWMMWRTGNQHATSDSSSTMMACCMPSQTTADTQVEASVDRLAVLRERRAALERELAELQQA